MKVLIIGGTGLISGEVARAAQRRGHSVTIFHRGSTPLPPELASVDQILGDRSDTSRFASALRGGGPWDCIIDMIGSNATDAAALADAVAGRASHIIACSTTSVYTRPFASVPVREDAPCAPTFPYGQNKLAYEETLRTAAARGDFALTIVRPGHTYNQSSRILHSLGNRTSHLDRLRKGRPVVVHDDGQGRWSMAWAADVGAGIAAAVGNERAKGRTYLLAGNETFTWDEYHRTVAQALGAPEPQLLHVDAAELARLAPERTLQCMRTLRFPGVYDCSAAAQDLRYRPCVGFAEGLSRNAAHLLSEGLIEDWSADPEYEQVVASCLATVANA